MIYQYRINNQTKIIFLIMVLGIFSFFGCFGKRSTTETYDHAAFTIERKNTYGKRYDINTASRKDDSRSSYRIKYKGQEIPLPDALEKNTGVSGLWKAYVLEDAPEPTILIGSQSVFLIKEDNLQPKVIPINVQHSSFASLQWLDAEEGKPGNKEEIYASNDTGKDFTLKGGRHLFVNASVVLDIQDLSIYPIEISAGKTDEYSVNGVVSFSPGEENIAFMGSKYDGNDHYAIITYNIKTSDASTIPFDRTTTRLHEPHDLQEGWFNTYFEWIKESDGSEVLYKIEMDSLLNWEGSFDRSGNYSIAPVKVEMLDVFIEFLKNELKLAPEELKREVFDNKVSYELLKDGFRIGISYLETLESVYFSVHFTEKNEEGAKAFIRKVGLDFNEVLKSGNHQSLFTSY